LLYTAHEFLLHAIRLQPYLVTSDLANSTTSQQPDWQHSSHVKLPSAPGSNLL